MMTPDETRPTVREWAARLRDWFRRDALDAELQEELRFHREHLERDALAGGAAPDEARELAARQLGNVTLTREAARERWSVPWLDHLLRDVRYALRGLRRSPGFTATVILTLGLGIGANVAMFRVVDQLLYRPLAYLRDPGQVHRIYWQWEDRGRVRTGQSGAYMRYLDLQRWTTSFSQFAAFSERNLAVGEGEAARELRVGVVSASYFAFFDAQPILGRFFVPDEDRTPRGADVAVLSHAFWQSEYGGRNVLGEILQVGNVRATIIGVAPRGFSGVNDAHPPVLFIPITTFAGSSGTADAHSYYTSYSWGWMHAMARRKTGISVRDAEADASQAAARSWATAFVQQPGLWADPAVARPRAAVSSLRPGAGPDPSLDAKTAVWLTVVALLVFVIAISNVANLMLARTLRRRREVAVRIALGGSRGRFVLQSLTEGAVLATLGGLTALVVAQWGGAIVHRLLVEGTGVPIPVLADARTLGVTCALSGVSALLLGLLPTLLAGRNDRNVAGALRTATGTRTREGTRLRAGLLVLQASLSVTLLVGATSFVRSLQAVRAMPMGYEADRVLLVSRVIRGIPFDDSTQIPLRRLLLETAQALPDIEAAAWVATAPFLSTSNTSLFVAGIDSVDRLGTFTYQVTTPDYFRAMGTRVLHGRGLAENDRFGTPDVIVVSQSMANVLWPGREALGECVRVRVADAPCTTVVGIAEDMVQRDITGTQRYHFYLASDQFRRTWGNGMVLRVRGDPATLAEPIRRALQRVMPGASYVTVRPLGGVVDEAQRSWRLGAAMFTAFGALSLAVAAVGLYGVIAYGVAERSHELAVRVALGASRSGVLRLVVGQSVRYTLLGVTLGLLVATAAGRWLQPLLFQQSARDPLVFAGVGLLMLAVALGASALPATRAARADPARALRAE